MCVWGGGISERIKTVDFRSTRPVVSSTVDFTTVSGNCPFFVGVQMEAALGLAAP